MNWNMINAIATTVSMVAFILTAIYMRAQLKGTEKDRYLAITNELYTLWQSRDFMESQLWLLYRLNESNWPEFVKTHRGEAGEAAFHRVGSFYDRVGTLMRLGLINENDILPTVGGYAIAVWQKIGPLVKEARRIENSTLFAGFEQLLPACHSCYVPTLSANAQVKPFSLDQPVPKITPLEVKKRLDQGPPLTLLDVRHPSQVAQDPFTFPGAILLPLDSLPQRTNALPRDQDVVAACACPSEESSGAAAMFLRDSGFRASALLGGHEGWRKAGLPMSNIAPETVVEPKNIGEPA